MEIDKTTLHDLAIFDAEDEFSIFHFIDETLTSNGKEQLKKNLKTPLKTIDEIKGIQETLRLIANRKQDWPNRITNGSIMVVERFYDSNIDPIPANASTFSAYSYKLLHSGDYSLIKYSVS